MKIDFRGFFVRFSNFFLALIIRFIDLISNNRSLTNSPKKILLIKAMMLGDVLFTTPSIASIRKAFPKAKITMLVGNWSKDVLENNPNIDEIISYDDVIFLKRKLFATFKLILLLRKKKFDWIINFHRTNIMHFFAYLIGAPFRVGLKYGNSGLFLKKGVYSNPKIARYPVEMYLDIVRCLNIPVKTKKIEIFPSQADFGFANDIFVKYNIENKNFIIAMFPGGAANPKEVVCDRRWNWINYIKIIELIKNRFDAEVILMGSKNDYYVCNKIYKKLNLDIINLSGKTSIMQTASILKKCNLVITNDSAPLHLAIAMDVPTIGLFGPTAGIARVPQDNPKYIAVQSLLSCSPCYGNERKFPGCKRKDGKKCMDYIYVEQVFDLLCKQIENCY